MRARHAGAFVDVNLTTGSRVPKLAIAGESADLVVAKPTILTRGRLTLLNIAIAVQAREAIDAVTGKVFSTLWDAFTMHTRRSGTGLPAAVAVLSVCSIEAITLISIPERSTRVLCGTSTVDTWIRRTVVQRLASNYVSQRLHVPICYHSSDLHKLLT
eukprot:SAG31_NODE_24853_length_473_cov_0.767380_1_plen_157_part_11